MAWPGARVAWRGVPGWFGGASPCGRAGPRGGSAGRAPGWHETPCRAFQSAVLGPVTGRTRRFVSRPYLTPHVPGRAPHLTHRSPGYRAGPRPGSAPAEHETPCGTTVGARGAAPTRISRRFVPRCHALRRGAPTKRIGSPTKGSVCQRRLPFANEGGWFANAGARFANEEVRLPTEGPVCQ